MSRRPFRAERQFGLTVGTVLAALGAWWVFRDKLGAAGPIAIATGITLVVVGLLLPRALRTPNRLWLRLGEALSFVTSRVVLAIVFYLLVTPIALVRRLLGGDVLRRRAKPSGSYWLPYSERHLDPRHYEKMF